MVATINSSETRQSNSTVTVLEYTLPQALAHLADEIARSRSLLELEADWDGEGSPGYKHETWRRAVDFAVRVATNAWSMFGARIDSVDIVPGAEGSIGLEWRSPGHELLINIPDDPNEEAPYYGDDGHGRQPTKGSLIVEKPNLWLSAWLAE
jgi:hypothetical protein